MSAARAFAALSSCLLVLLMALSPAPAPAAGTSVADIEDEVMCPICGTLLELSSSPQAQRERAFIDRLVGEGKSKAEIKDALVAEYGSEVLAEPSGSGFELSAYVVPALAFLIAAVALAVGIWRWRRGSGRNAGPGDPDGPSDADAERLEADLARYDL